MGSLPGLQHPPNELGESRNYFLEARIAVRGPPWDVRDNFELLNRQPRLDHPASA